MSELLIIVNPAAGRGRALRWIQENESSLSEDFPGVSIVLTSEPGEARHLAATAPPEIGIIAGAGGDGTINEILNGMDRRRTTLAIIPVGSGNDTIKALDIPSDPMAATRLIKYAHIRRVDCGRVGEQLFINSLAMGIDGAVAEWINKRRWLPPALAYHAGILSQIVSFRNRTIIWKSEDAQGETKANLLAVMNGHTYGGGFRIAPQAKINDGKLDLVIVGNYGVLGRMRHLPKVKTGDHLKLEKVSHLKLEQLTLHCTEMPPIALDGELMELPDDISQLSVEIVPGAVSVIVPPPASDQRHH